MNTCFSKLFSGSKYVNLILVAIIATLTVFIYYNSLNNQFLNDWDDGIYITNNPDLKTEGLIPAVKKAFTSYSNGHYHPLTTLTYVLEHKYFGLDPKPYHTNNLILHILNSVVVFAFVRLLLQQTLVAFITALLFAVHPMHVESVAWISDRKDLLCTLFFVGAMCTYLQYHKHHGRSMYIYTWLLFLLALFSKSMAITLPILFFVIDYFIGRKFTLKTVYEKLPFLVLSLIFGYLSILSQKSNDALGDIGAIGLFDRLLFSSYALLMYIVKLFSFGSLSAFYNYPISVNGKYPIEFYLAPVIVIALLVMLYKAKWNKKIMWFGFGFFFITVALVLQIVPAGNVIMADRYTYLPYIGFFIIIGVLVNSLVNNPQIGSGLVKVAGGTALCGYALVCCYYTFNRSAVWHDSMTFWSDTIKKNPEAALPYSNRGALLLDRKQFENAITDLNRAIDIRPHYVTPHFNRGLAYLNLRKFREAADDFTFVLKNNPRDLIAVYMNRASAYMYGGNYMKSIEDYSAVLKLEPYLIEAHCNRGLVYYTINQFEAAINDYGTALRISPRYAQAYYLRALALYKTQNYKPALQDALAAQQLGYPVEPSFMDEVLAKGR